MANDDRYGDRDRGSWRSERDYGDRDRSDWERGDRNRSDWGRPEERGYSSRQDERSYDRGYGRDRQDRDPSAHTDYYRGGDDQRHQRWGGGFESRGDYRRTDRYADQGASWSARRDSDRGRDRDWDRDGRREDNHHFSDHGHGGAHEGSLSGSGGVSQSMGPYGGSRESGYGVGSDDAVGYSTGGDAGPGFDPNFAGGPRFDRADVGSVGTHGAHPVASAYGQAQSASGYGGGMGAGGMGGGSARARAILDQHEQQQGGSQQSRRDHDPHYSEWRRRQIEELDRDYDEYRRENASRFHQEFGSWRETRGQQRKALVRCAKDMEVVGSDGKHVGRVDEIANDRIILAKNDPNAGGHHHSVPCSWIEKVDDKVTINKTAEEAMEAWRDEETSRALFEPRGSGSSGPHVLERSFSGTYRDE